MERSIFQLAIRIGLGPSSFVSGKPRPPLAVDGPVPKIISFSFFEKCDRLKPITFAPPARGIAKRPANETAAGGLGRMPDELRRQN